MNERPVALITGAAGGIGAATALRLAGDGYRIAASDVDSTGLDAVVAATVEAGGEAAALAADLSDMASVESLVPAAIERFGRLDVLVNNAAWREAVTMRHVGIESWERTMRICVTAPAFMARAAAESMARRGGGVIVNVSSIMAQRCTGAPTAYVAAKAAIDAITRDLAVLYAPDRVRVVGVAPGAIGTAMSDGDDAALRARSESMIPLGRWGEPHEVAGVIGWLVGESASYVTGTTIVVDGGLLAQVYRARHESRGPQR